MNLLSKASRVFTIVHSRSFRLRAFETIGSRRYVNYKDLDEASQKHSGDLDEDERFWSSEDEGVKDVDAGVGATAGETEAVTGVGTKVGRTKVHGEGSNTHRVYNSKCGSKQLIPMDAILAKNIVTMSEGKLVRVRALPDLGSSASIISMELAVKLGLEREDPGLTKLEDASGSRMDVTAVASLAVRELSGIPSYFQVLVSRDLGEDNMVVGIDELSLKRQVDDNIVKYGSYHR